MTRRQLAERSAYVAAALLIGTAVWHQTGYASITNLAGEGSPALRPLLAILWVHFALALILTAALVLIVARVGASNRMPVLIIAALTPLVAAALQLAYLGFIPPTALLLVDGLTILLAAFAGGTAANIAETARQ